MGVTQMERQLLMASGELKRGGFNSSAGNAAVTDKSSSGRMMTGLEYDRMMYQERLKLSEKWSEEYVGLQMQLRETEYQMQVERLTSTIQNESQLSEALKVAEQVKQQDLYNIAMDGYVARLTAADYFAEQEEEIIDNTSAMESHIETVRTLSSAFAQLGGAMAGTGDKAAASAGAIITATTQALPALQALFTTSSTAAVAEGIAETPTLGGKIAAGITLTATILNLVSTLKSIQNYAEGGVITGHNWNDGITARVSSGEMMINEADQKRLYDYIHTGNLGGGGGGPAYLTGEMIVLAVNNYGRRTNKGELVFAGR
jgi:antitoxin component HigA of HigAB toxin-antitoxin module